MVELQDALDSLRAPGEAAPSITLLVLDLHQFKRISRLHGPAVATRLLAAVEQRFLQAAKHTPMFHLGVDEFAFLHCDNGRGPAESLASALMRELEKPFTIAGHAIRMHASIGLACCGQDVVDAEELLHQATIALHHARKQGTGRRSFFSLDVDQRHRLGHSLSADLPTALHNGEVRPFYQPIVSLGENALIGYEALARWQHPRHGLLMPDVFLPILEEMDLLDDLLFTVVEQACHDVQALPAPVRISMNITPSQLNSEALMDHVIDLIGASGLSYQLVTLEVTEDSETDNAEVAQRSLGILRDAGIQIALDDFGSGYANLQRLALFPPDSIKIDRGLTRTCDTELGYKLLSTVIELGHSLDLPIVAEGIETKAQAQCLMALGCDYAQGYLYGRPVPLSALLDSEIASEPPAS